MARDNHLAEKIAGAYSLIQTAGTPTLNGADTLLKAGTNYISALIVLRSLGALFDSRKHAGGFFSLATIVAILAIAWLFLSGTQSVFIPYLMWLMPLGFIVPGIYFTFNSTEYFRSRIYPYEGKLLMHQIPSINYALNLKALCGHAASALTPVYLWITFKAMVDYVFGGTGARVVNAEFQNHYPRPVPPLGYFGMCLPLSIGAAIMGYMVHTGTMDIYPLIGLIFVIPGLLAFGASTIGRGLDVMRFLSEGSNILILNHNLLEEATKAGSEQVLRTALTNSVMLDETIKQGLDNQPAIPDRFY